MSFPDLEAQKGRRAFPIPRTSSRGAAFVEGDANPGRRQLIADLE
jgi:hypothetical protein